MKAWVGAMALIASLGMSAPGAHAVQERAAVQAVRVAPDTVELGDPFTLRANVYVPSGRDLRVPATLLPEWGVESLRRVRTDVVEAGDGSLQVVLEYDLIPFEIGLAATPQLEMTSGDAEVGRARVRVEDGPREGDPVGADITQITQNTQNMQNGVRSGPMVGADSGQRRASARDAVAGVEPASTDEPGEAVAAGEPSGIPEASGVDERRRDRLVVAGRRVFVTSPILLDDIARGLEPRPPADVVGSSWHVPAVLGASLLSLLLLGVGTVQAREWLAARVEAAVQVETPPETPEEWRERALGELDRVRARGHHRAGRLRDFYEDAGDAVREYVAHFDSAWDRSRTSTELMRDLSAAPGWPDPDALARAMGRGEVAKFAAAAGVCEDAAATADERAEASAIAERDWRTMRAWVDRSGRAPAFLRMQEVIAGQADPAGASGGAADAVDPAPACAPEAVSAEDIPDDAAATAGKTNPGARAEQDGTAAFPDAQEGAAGTVGPGPDRDDPANGAVRDRGGTGPAGRPE